MRQSEASCWVARSGAGSRPRGSQTPPTTTWTSSPHTCKNNSLARWHCPFREEAGTAVFGKKIADRMEELCNTLID
jgi:hypothetical protein